MTTLTQRLRVQCSWCGQIITAGDEGAATTHTICAACTPDYLAELSEAQADGAPYYDLEYERERDPVRKLGATRQQLLDKGFKSSEIPQQIKDRMTR
jgi:hypothetical protein